MGARVKKRGGGYEKNIGAPKKENLNKKVDGEKEKKCPSPVGEFLKNMGLSFCALIYIPIAAIVSVCMGVIAGIAFFIESICDVFSSI